MKESEDLINEVRTVQKQLKRLTSKLVVAGVIAPGGDDTRFLYAIDQYLYAVVSNLVDLYYYQASVLDPLRKDPPVGGSSGGLAEWIIDQLKPYSF